MRKVALVSAIAPCAPLKVSLNRCSWSFWRFSLPPHRCSVCSTVQTRCCGHATASPIRKNSKSTIARSNAKLCATTQSACSIIWRTSGAIDRNSGRPWHIAFVIPVFFVAALLIVAPGSICQWLSISLLSVSNQRMPAISNTYGCFASARALFSINAVVSVSKTRCFIAKINFCLIVLPHVAGPSQSGRSPGTVFQRPRLVPLRSSAASLDRSQVLRAQDDHPTLAGVVCQAIPIHWCSPSRHSLHVAFALL